MRAKWGACCNTSGGVLHGVATDTAGSDGKNRARSFVPLLPPFGGLTRPCLGHPTQRMTPDGSFIRRSDVLPPVRRASQLSSFRRTRCSAFALAIAYAGRSAPSGRSNREVAPRRSIFPCLVSCLRLLLRRPVVTPPRQERAERAQPRRRWKRRLRRQPHRGFRRTTTDRPLTPRQNRHAPSPTRPRR